VLGSKVPQSIVVALLVMPASRYTPTPMALTAPVVDIIVLVEKAELARNTNVPDRHTSIIRATAAFVLLVGRKGWMLCEFFLCS